MATGLQSTTWAVPPSCCTCTRGVPPPRHPRASAGKVCRTRPGGAMRCGAGQGRGRHQSQAPASTSGGMAPAAFKARRGGDSPPLRRGGDSAGMRGGSANGWPDRAPPLQARTSQECPHLRCLSPCPAHPREPGRARTHLPEPISVSVSQPDTRKSAFPG
jgi:hypothetical protein